MFLSFLKRLLGSRDPIEVGVRLSARILAKTLYFFYKHYRLGHFKNPKIAIATTTLVVASKHVKVIAKKFKRFNVDPQVLFEQSIDAVTEAY